MSRFESSSMAFLEYLLRLAAGNIAYHDGSHFRGIASGTAMANGVALDPTEKRLYVAASRSKNLLVYAYNTSNPVRSANPLDKISLNTLPDNLEWDQACDPWLEAQPRLVCLYLYLLRVVRKAPSEVLPIHLTILAKPVTEQVYRDDGTELSASSVAAVYHKDGVQRLLIGSLNDHFLACDLKSARPRLAEDRDAGMLSDIARVSK